MNMNVTFTHPRTNDQYEAQVSPHLTAGQALVILRSPEVGAFIPAPRPGMSHTLTLQRTKTIMSPDMTMAEAGVVEGDVLAVEEEGNGA